jgi:phosphoribosylformylglycinamidine synthase
MAGRTEKAMSKNKATVYVRLKDGVLDPQGLTIERAIKNMGYDVVESVRSGRFFELDLGDNQNAEDKVKEIGEKLLSNPVIENFNVEFKK